jgi:pilus assembly protein CpaC
VIPLNRSELLVYDKEMKEVVIADPNVADVVVHGSSRVSVVAKALGRTNLRVFDASGTLVTDAVVVITYDLPEIRRALKNFFPNERIGVELVNNNVAITGMISDAETSQRAVRIVEEYVGGQRTKDDQQVPAVINLAKIRSGQQVMLRVRVGEMQRTTAKQLGLNLDAARSVGNFAISLGSAAVSQGETSRITAGLNAGSASLSALLDALEKEGLFKVLAEPNLVAISGERAEFLAGGEFPIPVAQGNGATSVQFREYGVGVQFTPLVLSPNRIRLVVQPEVSEIDSSVATRDGTPGLLSRRVKTTVELAPGESFMIAGLIQDTAQSSVREMPGLSEIPILGSMLRRSTYQRFERELVIAVTPYLVDPISGAELRMPSDDFRAPSLMESFFFGALGSLSGDVLRKSQVPSLEGPVGFMVD